uniref:Uncharacterized protein AlNc14C87G5546 n=1 Tax=Albugo laibachii Nc14 TaxID=890382 RepID=F0WG14_9STRA|nr:conserved hypothetical protein [Albugo laibachii Nc14]|eukprot:CCA20148.1 conserved hypothetical protein [Albugo laibachii Nc14]
MAIGVVREVDRAIGAATALLFGFGIMMIRECLRPPNDRFKWSQFIATKPDQYHQSKFHTLQLPLFQHYGSCECNSMRFLVLAPKIVDAFDDSNTISCKKGRFPYMVVPISCFDMLKSSNGFAIYETSSVQHVFCRNCGIHIFHFDKNQSEHVAVNVFCMEEDTFDTLRIIFVPKGSRPIYGSFPLRPTNSHISTRPNQSNEKDPEKAIDTHLYFQKQLMMWAHLENEDSNCPTASDDSQSTTSSTLATSEGLQSTFTSDVMSMKSQLEYYLKRHLEQEGSQVAMEQSNFAV